MRALIDDQEDRFGEELLDKKELKTDLVEKMESWDEDDLEDEWDDLEERLSESLIQVKEETSQREQEESVQEKNPAEKESVKKEIEETKIEDPNPEMPKEKKKNSSFEVFRKKESGEKEPKASVGGKAKLKSWSANLDAKVNRIKTLVMDWYEGTSYVEKQEDEISAYRTRIWLNRRKTIIRRMAIAVGILLAFGAVKTAMDHWRYRGYEVLSMMGNEEFGSRYVDMNGNLLKYSADGVSLMNGKDTARWTDAYEMTSPGVDICEGTAAIYDQRGSSVYIYNEKGSLGKITTEYPILKVRVAKQGVVAAMLEDGENTWLNVYTASGEKIVASKTRVDSPGFPIDFDLSEDGMLMAVSYLSIEGEQSKTRMVFYNFGNVGQNQTDNIVKEIEYPNLIIPRIEYLNNSTALAYREDGFSVYEGAQIPEEDENVKIEGEIVSAFHDDKNVGVIMHSDNDEKAYTMRVYGMNGRIKFERDFDVKFTTVRISGGNILLYNDTQLCVYSLKGVERFNETIQEGSIEDVFKIDSNRYIAILSTGICTFKLK